MIDEPRVSLSSRKLVSGRRSYSARWRHPVTSEWQSKRLGTIRKEALRESAKMEKKLREGTYREIESIGWDAFVEDYVAKLPGKRNAIEAKRSLEEFGTMLKPTQPNRITYSMVKRFVAELRDTEKPNKPATIHKKLTYLRAAYNEAIECSFAQPGTNPVKAKLFPKLEVKPPRICTDEEETALLKAAGTLYGDRMKGFIITALDTGGRRGELLRLSWDRVTFGKEPEVLFTHTKSKKDRIVPIDDITANVLQRLKAQTLVEGGPFIGMGDNMGRCWGFIRKKAEVSHMRIHDLRATYITRLIQGGANLPAVQKLAGHANIKTTLDYYNWTNRDDLRLAVSKLRNRA